MQDFSRHRTFVERRSSTDLTPAYEDFGLFKTEVLPVALSLTPIMHRNSRADLVMLGFVKTDQRFEVVFAGRRAAMAAPLVRQLEALKEAVFKQDKDRAEGVTWLETIRFPVLIEGCWRRRHWTDETGWQHHLNQLVAAKWSMAGADGRRLTFGVSPSHTPRPELSVMGHRRTGERRHIQKAAGSN